MKRAILVAVVLCLCGGLAYVILDFRAHMTRHVANEQCYLLTHRVAWALWRDGAYEMVSGERLQTLVREMDFKGYGKLIVKDAHGAPLDVWGNRFSVSLMMEDEEACLEVISPGPDGLMGNQDDVSLRELLRPIARAAESKEGPAERGKP